MYDPSVDCCEHETLSKGLAQHSEERVETSIGGLRLYLSMVIFSEEGLVRLKGPALRLDIQLWMCYITLRIDTYQIESQFYNPP